MKRHSIAYIDEQNVEIRRFKREFDDQFDVIGLLPTRDMTELVDEIFKLGVSAVVTDYLLSEYRLDVNHEVNFDGVTLVAAIQEIRDSFPCFVLTSFDSDAIQESNDVNIVYPKDALDPSMKFGSTTFKEKVRIQIEHYQSRILEYEKEFEALLKKRGVTTLNEQEEFRLLELDSLLEASVNRKRAFPENSKTDVGIQRLVELVERSGEVLRELKEKGATQ